MSSHRFSIGLVFRITVTAIILFVAILPAVAYTPPSGNAVDFNGYVYYSDGVTPVIGGFVTVYYPADSADPAYQTRTSDSGYYSVGGPNIGKYPYKVYASIEAHSSPEVTGLVYNTGDHQQFTNDLTIPLSPPATIYGYVTRGGAPAYAWVSIIVDGAVNTAYPDSTTGYYSRMIYMDTPHSVNITASWSSDNIFSPKYHINQLNPGDTVRQDIVIPTQTVTAHIRTFNDGAPVSGATLTVAYGPYNYISTTNSTGERTGLLGYYAGQTMTITATVGGNTLSHTFSPEPDGTINYDFNFGTVPTPTPTPTPLPTPTPTVMPTVTPTVIPTAIASPTATASPGGNVPSATAAISVVPSIDTSSNNLTAGNVTQTARPSIEPSSTGIPTTYAILGVGVIVVLLIVIAYLLGTKKK